MTSLHSDNTFQANEQATVKAKGRNSRTGCNECKAKRLKCDETRPSCLRCSRRGQRCPGYSKQYRWSTVHEKIRPQEKPASYWPQAEQNAFLCALPQPQESNYLIHTVPAVPADADPVEAITRTPPLDLPTPRLGLETEAPSDSRGDFTVEETVCEDSSQLSQLAPNSEHQVSWDTEQDLDWLGDQMIGCGDGSTIDDLFDFGSPSAQSTDPQAGEEQDVPAEVSVANALSTRASEPMKLLYTPVNVSTMLMEYWFSDVCPMWSAFDSPTNPHRQLASTAWQHSEAVFCALQSMSAACLVETLPHLKKNVAQLSSQAVEAIQRDVDTHKRHGANGRNPVPRELLLSIIAMGTSVCWTDTRQLGLWFLAKAHELLAQYEDRASQVESPIDHDLLYFREALVYWEMLYRVIGCDPGDALKKRRALYRRRLERAMSGSGDAPMIQDKSSYRYDSIVDGSTKRRRLAIHPWTGISTDIQHTFGLVIALCRSSRTAAKSDLRTTAALSDALCDINLARDLASELLEAEIHSQNPEDTYGTRSRDTGDNTTPIAHLVDTAEAYRLASLLLLCQTFPDLDVEDVIRSSSPSLDGTTSHNQNADFRRRHALLALTMQLVTTLQRIPAESGTRCIQPVLFIAAGSGLSFDTQESAPCHNATNVTGTSIGRSDTLSLALLSHPTKQTETVASPATLTQCTLEVARGRRFIVDRLCALQRSLPPKPIAVALELVKAIWAECDDKGTDASHWIDVMMKTGLQTLFG